MVLIGRETSMHVVTRRVAGPLIIANFLQRGQASLIPRLKPHPAANMRRRIFTPAPHIRNNEISTKRYNELSDATMDLLLESLEALLDSQSAKQFEVEYSNGVLTLNLGDKGTYVINKQPPNKQIWLSSPVSGPKRYDYLSSQKGWYYSRDGKSIGSLLEEELSQVFGFSVDLNLDQKPEKTG